MCAAGSGIFFKFPIPLPPPPQLPAGAAVQRIPLPRVPQPRAGAPIQRNRRGTDFPDELMIEIFSYLSIIELTKCFGVNKEWRRVASDLTLWNAFDLKTIFHRHLKVFDESDWNELTDLSEHGLSIEDALPLDKRLMIPALWRCLSSLLRSKEDTKNKSQPLLRTPLSFAEFLARPGDALLPDNKDHESIALLTIPKGLTVSRISAIAESHSINASTWSAPNTFPRHITFPRSRYEGKISTEEMPTPQNLESRIGDIPIANTYRIVIMTKGMQTQKALDIPGCELSSALEATTLHVIRLANYDAWHSSLSHYDEETSCAEPCWTIKCAFRTFGDQLWRSISIRQADNEGSINKKSIGIMGVWRNF